MRFALAAPFPWMFALAVTAVLVASGVAGAQPQSASGPPNALQGFSQHRNQPIKIDAASLEVRDKDKVATFSGNVQLVQGDTVLTCKTMAVFYNTDAKTATSKDGAGQQNIRRIEVNGDVVVTQKDQKATADKGFFDMKSNVITLVGNVVISQGQNVVKGDRLSVDLTTSVSRVECEKSSQCRVQALLQPGGSGLEIGGARDAAKPKPSGPSGL